ncbi:hypothetical protein GRI89_04810 [Altererythrobacter salegens]|uniref:Uncharacterized protein n=1 Tax=Croceibacterium salegens TaxID=1737568 RepID=A0A6I4SUZ4_9SPHN|nr:hypothetical protein [Croceibacterium salegens]MXO58860.1 hypothetical protein [Croceibacterium salegens]
MKPDALSIIVLVGWLILVVAGFRSYRVSGRKVLLYGVIWASIFIAVALVFYTMGA